MAINNGAISCTTVNSVEEESTHRHSLTPQLYSCQELGIHKNDREAELFNELYDVRICGLVKSSE